MVVAVAVGVDNGGVDGKNWKMGDLRLEIWK